MQSCLNCDKCGQTSNGKSYVCQKDDKAYMILETKGLEDNNAIQDSLNDFGLECKFWQLKSKIGTQFFVSKKMGHTYLSKDDNEMKIIKAFEQNFEGKKEKEPSDNIVTIDQSKGVNYKTALIAFALTSVTAFTVFYGLKMAGIIF